MSRHAKYGDWKEGEYVYGVVSAVDGEGRGRIGGSRSRLRVSGDVEEGDWVTAEIQSTEDGVVLAEPTDQLSGSNATVWVQQSSDSESTVHWHPAYPLRLWPKVFHCNLFTEAPAGDFGRVRKDEAPEIWKSVGTALSTALGLIILGALFYFVGLPVLRYLGDSVFAEWGTATQRSPPALLLLLVGLALTYAGWATFEALIRLVGALVGAAVGFGVGTAVVASAGLSGNATLLAMVVAVSGGAAVGGALFLLLHHLAILVGGFASVAVPTFYLLSGGALLALDWSSLSLWLSLSLLVSVVLGCVAAIITLLLYKVAVVVITSFLGASLLVYVPTLAQSTAREADVAFPKLSFVVVFVTGVVVQLLFSLDEE